MEKQYSSSSKRRSGKKLSDVDVDDLDDVDDFLMKAHQKALRKREERKRIIDTYKISEETIEYLPPSDDRKNFAEHPCRVNNMVICECTFKVTKLAPVRDNVTRIYARGQGYRRDTLLQLELNPETYSLDIGDKFTLLLTPIPNPNGAPHTGYKSYGGSYFSRYDFEYEMSGILSKLSVIPSPDTGDTYPFRAEVSGEACFGTLYDEGLVMKMKNIKSTNVLWQGQSLSLLIKKV